jgi:ribosomal protein S4
VLYRAKFCHSIRSARQLISHGKVEVNKSVIFCKSYTLKPGDLVTIKKSFLYMVKKYYAHIPMHEHIRPHPPTHLYISYTTFSIIFGTLYKRDLPRLFTFNLKAAKILLNFLKK